MKEKKPSEENFAHVDLRKLVIGPFLTRASGTKLESAPSRCKKRGIQKPSPETTEFQDWNGPTKSS